MLYSESYKQAMAAPTGKGGRGWKYAEGASIQASMAMSLGIVWCLSPEPVYDWANRHNVSLWDERKRLTEDADLLLVAVLNDWSLERTDKEIAKARQKAAKGR